jgi:galactokinase
VRDSATAFAPGRVNLIGEHTDYNEGLALPFAISDGVTVRATPTTSGRIEAVATDLRRRDSFSLRRIAPADGWRAFLRGAAAEVDRHGAQLTGATLEISGTVPRGSGLSSSAALEVALTLALFAISDAPVPARLELARLCSRIENDWVGARTGLLDQLASLYGERDTALEIDFRALTVTRVPLDLGEFLLVTLDSGERHAIADSGYNRRREECADACRELGVASLRDATLEMAERLPEPLAARARHVVSENDRVRAAVRALAERDFPALGRLLDASHASLRDCYDVSTPAVEATVQRLRQAGALGARIVGGGFGGNVLGLLPPGISAPPGAVSVTPGPGAALIAGSLP